MAIRSRRAARRLGLPEAATHNVRVERNIPILMPDGANLPADRYYPSDATRHPTILVRTPYGRRRLRCGWLFAERGFQVLIQSVRGSYDADGTFEPFTSERPDGVATIEWIKQQDWYNGRLATFGASYLGYTQWAVADHPELMAMSVQVAAASFEDAIYPGGGFALDDALIWAAQRELDGPILGPLRQAIIPRRVRRHLSDLPIASITPRIIRREVKWLDRWLERDEAYWELSDQTPQLQNAQAPVHMTTGWHDFLLPLMLRDYATLRAAGHHPHLTIGPWPHGDAQMVGVSMTETLDWFGAHLLGNTDKPRPHPVRIYVGGGSGIWRCFDDWPPPLAGEQRWYLHPGGRLALDSPPGDGVDRYRYDPAAPTPLPGGPRLCPDGPPVVDNREHEARHDVLTYTSPPLHHALEIIGPVRAEIYLRSSCPHTDIVVRLCDVDPAGTSRNVCDGMTRCDPGIFHHDHNGILRTIVNIWPTAYQFSPGHRLRIHVSSGAHPRLARNLGNGHPPMTATTMKPTAQEIFRDPDRPSAIVFSIIP